MIQGNTESVANYQNNYQSSSGTYIMLSSYVRYVTSSHVNNDNALSIQINIVDSDIVLTPRVNMYNFKPYIIANVYKRILCLSLHIIKKSILKIYVTLKIVMKN